jgi:hypothetical protein
MSDSVGSYYCSRCGRRHNCGSRIGAGHWARFYPNIGAWHLPQFISRGGNKGYGD